MAENEPSLKLRVRIQRHLVVAHIAEDSGEWVFTICRRGFEALIGKRFKTGQLVDVEVTGKLTAILESKKC